MRRTVIVIGLFVVVALGAGAAVYAGKLPFLDFGQRHDPIALVPNGAQMMFEISVSSVLDAEHVADAFDKAEEDAKDLPHYEEAREAFAGIAECGYELASLDRIAGGMTMDDNMVLIATGTGIGSEEKLRCLAENDAESATVQRNGRTAFVLERMDGSPESIVYFVSDDLVLLVDPVWEPQVLELLEGRGTPARDGNLSGPYADVDPSDDIWFAGVIPDEVTGEMGAPGVVTDVVAGAKLGDGFDARLVAAVNDEAKARELLEGMQPFFKMARASASLFGVPDGVIERAKLEVTEGKLRASVDANADEMKALEKVVEKIGKMAEASAELEGALGEDDESVDMPVPAFLTQADGECAESYRVVEGVCVHLAYRSASNLYEEIERYKRGGASPTLEGREPPVELAELTEGGYAPPVHASPPETYGDAPDGMRDQSPSELGSSEREACEQARASLEELRRDLARGADPMPAKKRARLVRERKESVAALCSGIE